MTGTRLVFPHCTAVLKSGKTLPVGKQVACVNCKHRFSFAPKMSASWSFDTHDDIAFALAETHGGTMKSPIVGICFPVPVTEPAATATSEPVPAEAQATPVSMSEELAASPEAMESISGIAKTECHAGRGMYDSPIDVAFTLLYLSRSDLVDDCFSSLHSCLDISIAAAPREGERFRGRERPAEQPR
jgi:hypothetical protein